MGHQIMRGVDDMKEKERLGERLNHIEMRWKKILSFAGNIK